MIGDSKDSVGSRSATLARYDILDTPTEQAFDDIARLAAAICEVPIAVVNLIADDRQWFKAEVGLGVRETPLETSFCAKAILEHDFLEVPDATQDPRFDCNPLVTAEDGLRFYAGALLKTEQGQAIGTVCVLDTVSRPGGLSELQRFTLTTLATQVMTQLECRRIAKQERQARLALESGRSRFEAVFDSAIDYAIVVMDRNGCVTDWNEGAIRILGWSPDEAIGRDLGFFFTPEDRERAIPQREMSDALAKGRGVDERWHIRQSGERFWANGEMMPLQGAAGEAIGFVKVLRDRTEARLIQEHLAQQDERLQMALSASGSVGLWDWMVASDLLHGDANFARLYGLDVATTAAGLTEEQYQEHVVPEDLGPLRARIRGVFERGEDFLVEYRVAAPGQPLRWIECKGRMVPDAAGRPYRFSGTAVDVTVRKVAEDQKQLLMDEMAHRVKNTFTMVQALAYQTLRDVDPTISAALQTRLVALSRAHEMLLQRNWTSTSIMALIERVLRLEAERGRFRLDGPDFEVQPQAALSLSLLLHELATNAVKYGALSVEGGDVSLIWGFEGDQFRLLWTEQGGPPVRPPERKGFGSKLVGMGLSARCRSGVLRSEPQQASYEMAMSNAPVSVPSRATNAKSSVLSV